MLDPRHRHCVVLRGTPPETLAQARQVTGRLEPARVLWVGGDAPEAIPPARVRRLLGQTFDAVVLDGHADLDPDVLGRCHGFILGGGALVLALPPPGEPPGLDRPRQVVVPFTAADVGDRFGQRVLAAIERAQVSPATPLPPPPRTLRGTAEQAEVVATLTARWAADAPSATALIADRGRGKSSALGLALKALRAAAPDRTVVVCATDATAAAEVFHFCGDPAPRFATPTELLRDPADAALIVVDEAAQIPVPVLQRIVHLHPQAHLAFATTTHGYEGTGRGFLLRFLRWLEAQPRPLAQLRLVAPIRWAAGDPLERFIFDALLLDAEPAPIEGPVDPAAVTAERLDRAALAADEQALRDFFGILVHAHYRTTPGDLQRMLDAPNMRLHALRHGERIIAACLVALEGDLPPEWIDRIYWGRSGVRGHALPETLICHGGHREAGALRMVRSVRIAVHPGLRRLGLGQRLVDAVHAAYQPDLFGTLFGATPALLAFRRSVGYALTRVGVSAGSRTGEPAAVMLRPVTPRAHALVAQLRGELARDLPLQLTLMQAGERIFLDPALVTACLDPLPPPAPLPPAERDQAVALVVFGARPFEAAAVAVAAFVAAHPAHVAALTPTQQALIQARVVERLGWDAVRDAAGLSTVRTAMRALRRALQTLALRAAPHLKPPHWQAPE